MFHFIQSELLSRRVAHFCCKRIAILFNEYTQGHFDKALKQLPQNPSAGSHQQYIVRNQLSMRSIKSVFSRVAQCPFHHEMLRSMLSIVYTVQLGCIQALVWNRVGENGAGGPFNGSALDFLPCAPSQLLPVLTRDEDEEVYNDDGWCEYARRELQRAEMCVRRRSLAVESRWASDKLRPAAIAIVQSKVQNPN